MHPIDSRASRSFRPTRRALGGLAATIVAALLYAAAFPPLDLRFVAWFCLVPFLAALRHAGVGGALLLGFLWGVLMGLTLSSALPSAITAYFLRTAWVGWGLALFVWTTTASLYYMAFAVVYRWLAFRYTASLPLLTAAAWVAAELARARLLTPTTWFVGNPWVAIGYSQFESPLMQIASIAGVYGPSFVLVAANAALLELGLAWRRGVLRRRRAWFIAASGVLPAGLAWVFGWAALRSAEARAIPRASVEVAIVQGQVELGSRWRSDLYGKNLDVYLNLTRRALREWKPEIVFWPEAALTFFLEDEDRFRGAIADVLRAGDVELVAGGPKKTPGDRSRYFNSVFLVSPRGEIDGRYDKEKLVPFAEYRPFGSADLARRRFEGVRAFRHGGPTAPLPTRAGNAGVLICNESLLPELGTQRVADGAEYLVNPSNDSWIADGQFAELMFRITAVRAIEQRRYLVRASTAGPSGVVDPWGRVRVRTAIGERGLARGIIEGRARLSTYGKVGDLFGLLCLGSVGAALVLGRSRR